MRDDLLPHWVNPWHQGDEEGDDTGTEEIDPDDLTWPEQTPTIEVSHRFMHPSTDEDLGYIGYDTANDARIVVLDGPDHIEDGLAWVSQRVVQYLADQNATTETPILFLGFLPTRHEMHIFPLEAFTPPITERVDGVLTEGADDDAPEAGVPLEISSEFSEHRTTH